MTKTGRFLTATLAAALIAGELSRVFTGTYVNVYAAEPDLIVTDDLVAPESLIAEENEVAEGSEVTEESVASDKPVTNDDLLTEEPELTDEAEDIDILTADGATDQNVMWQTGVATIGELVPGGKTMGPALNVLGGLLGVGDEGLSQQDLINKLKDVNKQISGLSKSISAFRTEMNKGLDKLERDMYAEIDDALNKITNDVFINGVGAELDTLQTQVSGRNGIAHKIDTINGDTDMTEEEKAIEIAYLIGNNSEWNQTQNALYRFKLVGNLLAGQTYRDTKGRNLYQVLYDNAAVNSKLSGEAYNKISPYIDRVVYEYFYAYTTLSQCLSASLAVSLMTDEEAKKLDAVTYEHYLECKTSTGLVKRELDNINKQLLDAKDTHSIVSMYSSFKYKQKNDACVYIGGGSCSIALSADLAMIDNPWIGKRLHEGNYNEESYYQAMSDFVSDGTNLDPDHVKDLSDHVNDMGEDISFLDYLRDSGFRVDEHITGNNACFAVSDLKTKQYRTLSVNGCEYGFDTFDPRENGSGKTWSVACEFTGEDQDTYATLNDISYLGFKIIEPEEMPETAEEIYELIHTDYMALIEPDDDGYELYQKYALGDIPVTFSVSENDVTRVLDTADEKYPDPDKFIWQFSGESCVYFDGSYIMFTAPGTCSIRLIAQDPEGVEFISDRTELTCRENHASRDLYIWQRNGRTTYSFSMDPAVEYDLTSRIPLDVYKTGDTDDEILTDIEGVWESSNIPSDGILLEDDGRVTFKRQGEYRVRYKVMDAKGDYAYSNWFTLDVNDPNEYFTYTFLDTDGSELYRITKKEGTAIDTDSTPIKNGYSFVSWDRLNSDEDDLPGKMTGNNRTYTALWTRTVKDGYTTVLDEASLKKAVAEASASETTRIALGNDISVAKLTFPKSGKGDIVIDGVGHILTFRGNAALVPKGGQSLTLEDMTVKAEKSGKLQNITFSAASGGLKLDNITLIGKNAKITATKGNLCLRDVISDRLTVAGSSARVLTMENEVAAAAVTGFGSVEIKGFFAPGKIMKANYIDLSPTSYLRVPKGVAITANKGISGTGTIELENGFKPLTLGMNNSGSITLKSGESLEHKIIFNSKATNLNTVFDVRGISPKPVNGKYEYRLYCKSGKACLRAFTIKCGLKTYCEWADVITDISKTNPAGESVITLLSDVSISGALKLPTKGKCTHLTINGGGNALVFNAGTVTLTGGLTLRAVNIRSKKGTWTLKKGRYEFENDGSTLVGCHVK